MAATKEHILVTGGAGFIGSHLVERLLQAGYAVTIIDNFDPFYPKSVKLSNIASFVSHPDVKCIELDITEESVMAEKLTDRYDAIIHLAAKAGVRPSIENPLLYQKVNVMGTQYLLEFARKRNIKRFIFASSSSVYGVNPNFPWKEDELRLLPISPYASTKISGELLGHVYSKLYGIRFIALRFFTVFGPRQRPDLAIHNFARKIINGQPIDFFGDGSTERDYTFVSDTVEGVYHALLYDRSDFEIMNLGNNHTVSLSEMLSTLEEVLGKKAIVRRLPEQPGDVSKTCADINKAEKLIQYSPSTPFREGVEKFCDWLLKN